jgi:eukaryotic-like serine/threonine-protein kinase
MEQVLMCGVEICDGLDWAHRSGVVHRDLKPGNIMLTKKRRQTDGLRPCLPSGSASFRVWPRLYQIPPETPRSPKREWSLGRSNMCRPSKFKEKQEVDGRSDIFSLRAVLYEMVTGKRVFEGKSQLSVAAAILEKEPVPISSVKPMTPPVLDHAIRCFLAKEPEKRWQSAHDLALELKWRAESGAQSGGCVPAGSRKMGGQWLAWSVAALLGDCGPHHVLVSGQETTSGDASAFRDPTAGSLMPRTSPEDPKFMFNLFRYPQTAAERSRSRVVEASSPTGGGMARN